MSDEHVGGIFLMAKSMKCKIALLLIIVLSWTGSWTVRATDYADPADIIQRNRERNQAMQGTSIEVDGMIESAKPGNPGWYSIFLELDNGNQLTLIVYPKTKFWANYKPLDAASAYKRFVHGQKLRIMHETTGRCFGLQAFRAWPKTKDYAQYFSRYLSKTRDDHGHDVRR